MREIPVLLYHNVGNYPAEMMEDGITAQAFARQMQYLSTSGYRIVSLDDAVNHLAGIERLPDRSLAITIDGGYEDAILNVAPVLRQYEFPAVFFIAPEFIGGERAIKGNPIRCLTWQEVRELNESGFTIGLLANGGGGIKSPHDVGVVKERIAAAMESMHANINTDIRYCAFKEGVPGADLRVFIQSQGIRAVFTQCPTNQQATVAGIGRIQIDDDDHNIFLTKISKLYLFFKDKRSWQYIRRYKIDRLAHRISETLDRIKRNK
ncbi:MAG: polysaccharide deacetylase family protein [Pseudomonadota bacterium]